MSLERHIDREHTAHHHIFIIMSLLNEVSAILNKTLATKLYFCVCMGRLLFDQLAVEQRVAIVNSAKFVLSGL